MPVRQVQAHEVQGHRLREVRRRGHRLEGPSRADGPYRTGRAGRAHLVPEVAAEPHRPAARHAAQRSEEHTSELQSLMRNSYAVFCLKKNNKQNTITTRTTLNIKIKT